MSKKVAFFCDNCGKELSYRDAISGTLSRHYGSGNSDERISIYKVDKFGSKDGSWDYCKECFEAHLKRILSHSCGMG